jgi:hypothetical protein
MPPPFSYPVLSLPSLGANRPEHFQNKSLPKDIPVSDRPVVKVLPLMPICAVWWR